MDTAVFPGDISETAGGAQYKLHARSIALLRLSTPEIVEHQKETFVASQVLADAEMETAEEIGMVLSQSE